MSLRNTIIAAGSVYESHKASSWRRLLATSKRGNPRTELARLQGHLWLEAGSVETVNGWLGEREKGRLLRSNLSVKPNHTSLLPKSEFWTTPLPHSVSATLLKDKHHFLFRSKVDPPPKVSEWEGGIALLMPVCVNLDSSGSHPGPWW